MPVRDTRGRLVMMKCTPPMIGERANSGRNILCARYCRDQQDRIWWTEGILSAIPRGRRSRHRGIIWSQGCIRVSMILSMLTMVAHSWTSSAIRGCLTPTRGHRSFPCGLEWNDKGCLVRKAGLLPTITYTSHLATFAKLSSADESPLESSVSSVDSSLELTIFDFSTGKESKSATNIFRNATLNELEAPSIYNNDKGFGRNINNNTIASSEFSSPSDLQTLQQVRARFQRKDQFELKELPPDIFYNTERSVQSNTEAMTSADVIFQQVLGQAYWASVLLVGTYVASCVLTDLLSNIEIVQTWRYLWPLGIGGLFVWGGWSCSFNGGSARTSSWSLPSRPSWSTAVGQPWLRLVTVSLGLGLIIGGAADALLPVYVTGPNAITNAGLAPDSAVVLFAWTLWQASRKADALCRDTLEVASRTELVTTLAPVLVPQMLLLAQLYKLGEGSFDELFFSALFFL